MSQIPINEQPLLADITQLIQSAKQRAAQTVNAQLTQLYSQVGQRIADEVLKGERAASKIKSHFWLPTHSL